MGNLGIYKEKVFLKLKRFRTDLATSLYYLKKIIRYKLKRNLILIGYTKNHPIYTSIFEDDPPTGYLFFYLKPGSRLGIFGRFLSKDSIIFHLDAANSDSFTHINKKIVIECEGRPYERFFDDPRIHKIFVESKWSGQEYIEKGNVTLLYPAIKINGDRLGNYAQDGNPEKITLCAVGYGGMIKGFDVVVRSYQELKEAYDLDLIIAGSFGHNFTYYPEVTMESFERANFSSMEQELKKDENVIFRSFKRKDLFNLVYPKADIYLHISRLETFGYSILEAMSFGLPVIASKLHAIPEMVKDGFNGLLVDAFNYDINSTEWFDSTLVQTKKALIRLISDPSLRMELGNNSIQMVNTKFSIERKKKILLECYNNI